MALLPSGQGVPARTEKEMRFATAPCHLGCEPQLRMQAAWALCIHLLQTQLPLNAQGRARHVYTAKHAGQLLSQQVYRSSRHRHLQSRCCCLHLADGRAAQRVPR